jgi:hypothetical protein
MTRMAAAWSLRVRRKTAPLSHGQGDAEPSALGVDLRVPGRRYAPRNAADCTLRPSFGAKGIGEGSPVGPPAESAAGASWPAATGVPQRNPSRGCARASLQKGRGNQFAGRGYPSRFRSFVMNMFASRGDLCCWLFSSGLANLCWWRFNSDRAKAGEAATAPRATMTRIFLSECSMTVLLRGERAPLEPSGRLAIRRCMAFPFPSMIGFTLKRIPVILKHSLHG